MRFAILSDMKNTTPVLVSLYPEDVANLELLSRSLYGEGRTRKTKTIRLALKNAAAALATMQVAVSDFVNSEGESTTS